jgi:hypothetical protein
MPLWDSISVGAKLAGDAAAIQAKKAKLKADIVLIDREISNRKKAFGVTMYDHVSPLSQSADFYAAEDPLTSLLRPPLIKAQKEIQALAGKRVKLKEALAQAETNRAAAFPTRAETVGQKLFNFGKASVYHGGETKIKAELALVDRSIKGHKMNFGLELFALLVDAEDNKGYLPSDRQVRNIYDTCRGDIHKLDSKKKLKIEEIIALGGTYSTETPADSQTGNDVDSNSKLNEPSQSTSSFQPPAFQPPTEMPFMSSGFSDNPPSSSAGGYSDKAVTNADGTTDFLFF